MHFCYVDESGSTGMNLATPEQPVFVMAGLLVSDEKWRNTRNQFTELVKIFFQGAPPEGFELHACDLLAPEGQSHFAGKPREERSALALDLLELLTTRSHQVLLVQVLKERVGHVETPHAELGFDWKDPWDLSLATMLTLFEEFLRGPQTGASSSGLMLIDHEPTYLNLLRERSAERQEAGGWRRLKKVTEIGYSATSHANPMIQFADLIAFSMRKALESESGYRATWSTEAHEFYAECKTKIWPRVQYKRLSFTKLNVPSALTDYLKSVRRRLP